MVHRMASSRDRNGLSNVHQSRRNQNTHLSYAKTVSSSSNAVAASSCKTSKKVSASKQFGWSLLKSENEFFKLVVAIARKKKLKSLGSIIACAEDWLAMCCDETFPVDESIINLHYESLRCLKQWLQQQSIPMFMLSSIVKKQSSDEFYSALSTSRSRRLTSPVVRIRINKEKEKIEQREVESVHSCTKTLSKANVGLQELKNVIKLEQLNKCHYDLPNEKRLKRVEEKLMDHISDVLEAVIKTGLLSSRSKYMILRILCGEPVSDQWMNQMDHKTISLLVNTLHIFRIETRGSSVNMVINDFSS